MASLRHRPLSLSPAGLDLLSNKRAACERKTSSSSTPNREAVVCSRKKLHFCPDAKTGAPILCAVGTNCPSQISDRPVND